MVSKWWGRNGVCVCLHFCVRVTVCYSMCVCVCMGASVCDCGSVCMHISVCMCDSMHVSVRLSRAEGCISTDDRDDRLKEILELMKSFVI